MAFPLLQANTKAWSKEEERMLKQLAKHNDASMLSLILGRPEFVVQNKAREMKVRLK